MYIVYIMNNEEWTDAFTVKTDFKIFSFMFWFRNTILTLSMATNWVFWIPAQIQSKSQWSKLYYTTNILLNMTRTTFRNFKLFLKSKL